MKSIWPKVPPKFVAQLLSGHSALGLAVGALMYVLCLSGTLAVFYNEFERWESPGAPEMASVSPQAAETAALNALALMPEKPHHFYVGLPTGDMPRLTVANDKDTWIADETGAIAGPLKHEWTHFLLNLHIYFHLPGVVGLTVVGVLGAMMVGLIVSGFLAHPRIFRDAFALRLSGAKRLAEADLHNRLSVWAAPFHLVIAATGAMIGLASVLALAVAYVSYGGDTTKVFAPIFGPDQPVVEKPADAPLADISAAMTNLAAAHPGVTPTYVSMHDPATDVQKLQMNALVPQRLIYSEIYNFNAAGELTGQVGLENGPAGQQAFAMSYPLHFGSFGGLPVRLAYAALGIALCVVCATGLNIWLVKRREQKRPAPRLERAWIGVVWGSPASLGLTLLAGRLGLSEPLLIALFWSGLAAAIIACIGAGSGRIASRVLRIAAGALTLAAVGVHVGMNGADAASAASLWITLAFAATGVAFIASAVRRPRTLSARAAATPAE